MKNVVEIYVFAFVISVGLANARPWHSDDDYKNCLDANNMTAADVFVNEELRNDTYKEASEERQKNNACFIECMTRKSGLMEGSEISEEKINSEISQRANETEQVRTLKIAKECIPKVKDIEREGCKRTFSLVICIVKNLHKERKSQEDEK